MPLQTPVQLMYDLETAILEKVVRLLVSGDNETYSQKWQLDKLRDLGVLNTEVQAVIKKYAKTINEKTYDDIDQTAKNILSEIQAVLPADMQVASSPIITEAVNKWVASAQGDLNYSLAKMAEGASQAYVAALNKAALQVITGQSTLQAAIRQAVTETANKGLPAYKDKAGREWSPEGYTQMVLRTNQARTADAVMFDTARQLGTDKFEVSSHIGARPLCAPYQGRVFTMQELQTQTSYGKAAGLRGINCSHVLYPFVEGMKSTYKPYSEARNEQVYKESQEQRYLERSIRNAKRKEQLYTAAGDKEKAAQARQSVKGYQEKLRDLIESTGRTRRYDREQIFT